MIQIGRFAILGDWDDSPKPKDHIIIRMPPIGAVFGAGWHEITQNALLALPDHITPGCSFAEIGAGSCILSIAAEKLGANPCYATEINPEALEAGRRVIKANRSKVILIEGSFIDEVVDIALVSISSQWAMDNLAKIKAKKILVVEDDARVSVWENNLSE